jgi:hypothetical protein
MKRSKLFLAGVGLILVQAGVQAQSQAPAVLQRTETPGLAYSAEFFPGVAYRPGVPTQESLVGFACGQRAASAAEVERCLKAWTTAAPDRTRLIQYASSHEGRPLHCVVVTSPGNLSRLKEIQAGYARLGDPRKVSGPEANQLMDGLPAVGWLAYNIHGDETEGADAALAILYHLIAARDPEVEKLLEATVVIIDPLMNPDGRDRFVKMIAEHRGASPNLDDQSLLHAGYWPRGRGNHYLFDLNRDSIYGVHPETRGRIREVSRWSPLLFVDAHGMGPQDTHLFSPPREPINPNLPRGRERWSELFGREQAAAFDRHRLLYYNGEWNEEWYPGYCDGWAAYNGAIGILYEQARIAEDGVRRPEGRILSYRESVHHHVIGSMANLATLQANGRQLLDYFHATRKSAMDPIGPYARRTFAILPTANRTRLGDFLEVLRLQGFEVFQAAGEFTAAVATDHLGRELKNKTIPAGTILVPNRQPLGHLVAAMLEFDPHFPAKVLQEERRELLQKGKSRIYDTTAWNLTMMFGLEALNLSIELPDGVKPWQPAGPAPKALQGRTEAPVGFVLDGADDRSVSAAARLMERGVQVRVAEKPFRFDGRDFARGSVVITPIDNRTFQGDLGHSVAQAAAELELAAVAVSSGLGAGDLPDLGGDHFFRLEPPRLALFGRDGLNSQDYGATWFLIDHHLGIRHSHLGEAEGLDLSRYNVLIIPDGRFNVPSNQLGALREWVRAGGTLIAVAGAATGLVSERSDFSKVRLLPEVLGRLAEYEASIFREWLGRTGAVPAPEKVWAHTATPGLQYPWPSGEGPHPEEKEMKRRDAWQALFMPQGALLASRVDTNHWLTFGCGEMLPVLVGRQSVLMAADGVETPVRYGYLDLKENRTNAVETAEAKPKAESTVDKKDGDKKKETPRLGWCALPEGTEMHLRLSGLVWPEAAQRLANGAWVTREPLGRGQIILFATPPAFRGAARGPMRILLNAAIYGPGFGAAQPVRP